MDGDLGNYLAEEMRAKGIYAIPRGCFDNGFQQLSITSKPVHSVADIQGMKIRTPNTALYIEAFQALGATPVPINIDKLYDSLKAHEVEAQTNPLTIIELFKLYEVQKYVTLTSHLWAGFNLMASLKRWERLAEEIREMIERNITKYVQIQRKENAAHERHPASQADGTGHDVHRSGQGFVPLAAWAVLRELEGKSGRENLESARSARGKAGLMNAAPCADSQEQFFFEWRAGHDVRVALGDQHHFLETHATAAAYTFDPNQRLDSKHHSRLKFVDRRAGKRLADIGRLVGADADAMPDKKREEAVF